jgi:hypothetical protein
MGDDATCMRNLADMDLSLLRQLTAGHSVKVAAAREYLSLRTANRRLAVLRELAGVESTADLVILYRTTPGCLDG